MQFNLKNRPCFLSEWSREVLRWAAAPILAEVMHILQLFFRDANDQNSMWRPATDRPPFNKTLSRTARLQIKKEWGRGEESGVRGVEEDDTGGVVWRGSEERRRGEGPGRQMPPLWPWHCGILIVRGHIVPTLLERCRAASPSHASIEMKWAEVWKKKKWKWSREISVTTEWNQMVPRWVIKDILWGFKALMNEFNMNKF